MASTPAAFAASMIFWDAEVALERRPLADTVGLVRVPHVEHVAVDGGIDGDGGDAHLAACAHHAERDLAAVGHQDLLEQAPLLPLREGTILYHRFKRETSEAASNYFAGTKSVFRSCHAKRRWSV